ncbi:glycosyltransferase, partial [candidate division KSB1 bacterium]|nr:glycosyltransferase [candidate division KSB1 bacterium]
YYCVDEYSEFEGVPADAIRELEQRIVRKADFVFVTSKALLEKKRNGNPQTHYIPHGVHIEHFNQALAPQTTVPSDIADIPHPIIGFYGLIESWLDLDMVQFLVESRPQWSFVFIGNSKVDLSQLQKYKNLHFLGRRNYQDLPGYNKAFDVAIIPFLRNELTRNVNPIKLREYLAAGSAVVTTYMPEIEQYKDIIGIADSPQDFLEETEAMLKKNSESDVRKRLQAVQAESWQARMEQLSKIIINRGN